MSKSHAPLGQTAPSSGAQSSGASQSSGLGGSFSYGHRPEAWGEAAALKGKIDSVMKFGGNLRQAGQRLMDVDGEKELLLAGQGLLTVADDVTNITSIYYTFQNQTVDLSGVTDKVGKTKKVINSLRMIYELTDDKSTRAFLEDPTDAQKAQDWAYDAADAFKVAADWVPGGIPFVSDMLTGYLKAPAAYVRVMSGILFHHINQIDLYAGISGSRTVLTHGDRTLWKGELSHLAQRARVSGDNLWQFMDENRKRDGVNLEKVRATLGVAHLIQLTERYAVSEGYTDERGKYQWIERFSKFA